MYGPWDTVYSHFDGKKDKHGSLDLGDGTNWGTVVINGYDDFAQWLALHATSCLTPNLDLTNSFITSGFLNSYDVIIILDISHTPTDLANWHAAKAANTANVYTGSQRPITNAEVTALQDWFRLGRKGLMTTIGYRTDAANSANVNKLLAPFGISYDISAAGVNILAKTILTSAAGNLKNTSPVALPITSGVKKLWVDHGSNILYPGLSESTTFSVYATGGGFSVGAARIFPTNQMFAGQMMSNESRLSVWADEWITYDDVWGNYDAGPYWDNILTWLSPLCQ